LERAQYKLNVDHKVIQAGKFDQKSTAEERDMLLKALLEEENQGNEEEEVFDDEELNQIISRNEEELNLFRKIDAETEKKRIDEWRSMGEKGVPTRLIDVSELPDIFIRNNEEIAPQIEEEVGRGKRQSKKVVEFLDDQLSEDQWLRIIDEGEDVQEVLRKRRERKEKRQKKKAGQENEASASEEEVETPARKKARKGTQEESPPPPRAALTQDELNEVLKEFIEAIETCQDKTGRIRSELFAELPSREDYPDYYEVIEQPIALDQIKEKLANSAYKSETELATDMELLFSNAKHYNQEDSQVYEDAVALQRIFITKLKQFQKGKLKPKKANEGNDEAIEEDDDETPRRRAKKKLANDDPNAPPKKETRGRKPKKLLQQLALEMLKSGEGDSNEIEISTGDSSQQPTPTTSTKKTRKGKKSKEDESEEQENGGGSKRDKRFNGNSNQSSPAPSQTDSVNNDGMNNENGYEDTSGKRKRKAAAHAISAIVNSNNVSPVNTPPSNMKNKRKSTLKTKTLNSEEGSSSENDSSEASEASSGED